MAPVRVDPAGRTGPTPGQARGPAWRSSSRGWHVPVDVDETVVGQRIVECLPLLTISGAVTGWAALHWCGAAWFGGASADGGLLDVPLLTAHFRRRQRGFDISQEQVRPDEIAYVDWLPVTVPVRSLGFEVRHARSWRDAVVALDMAAYSDLVSTEEAARYIATIGPWTGVIQARKALAHADENAWSPREVVMRLLWTQEAHLPRPRCNIPVFDLEGRHLGTPDLFDPVAGVAGEYEGSMHLAGRQRVKDVRREGDFRDHGIEAVTMVAAEDRAAFVARLHAAYARSARPGRLRRWTIEPPAWWVRTDTVARRRSLSAEDQRRLLRYRRAA